MNHVRSNSPRLPRAFVVFLLAVALVVVGLLACCAAYGVERDAPGAPYGLSRGVVHEWQRVHHCEERSWHVRGATFDGGLGISHVAWNHSRPWWADPKEWRAPPLEQVYVGRHIERAAGLGNYVPDQRACSAW